MEAAGSTLDLAATSGFADTLKLRSRSEVLNESVQNGSGILSDFKTQKEIRAALDQSNALRHIDKLKRDYQNKAEGLEAVKQEKAKQKKHLESLDGDCDECQDEIDQLRRAIPTELQRRQQETMLRKRHETAMLRADQQRTLLTATENNYAQIDKAMDHMQLELFRSEALEEDLRGKKAVSEYEQSVKAEESSEIRKRAELRVKAQFHRTTNRRENHHFAFLTFISSPSGGENCCLRRQGGLASATGGS
jgi:hypothetical protein